MLIANFVWFAFSDATATQAQTGPMLGDPLNQAVLAFVDIFVTDKANTLFALLFGFGFWVQMERLETRGAPFARIYLRRLAVLLAMGLINICFIWPWDILNLYALAGFALFALRGLSPRAMLWLGVPLALLGRPLVDAASEALGIAGPAGEMIYSESAVLARQWAYTQGSYLDWLGATADLNYYDWLASGAIIGWLLYALGRFLVGAWVARAGWLQRAGELLPQMCRICLVALPLGLALETLALAIGDAGLIDAPGWVSTALHAVAVPVLDLGYATGMVLLFHSRWRVLAFAFAPVGRMALTNYLAQGVFIGALLYGFNGGLALAGTIEPKQVLPACLAFFAAQMLLSHWWLARYRFGPLEWLWRALTYGTRPPMRPAGRVA